MLRGDSNCLLGSRSVVDANDAMSSLYSSLGLEDRVEGEVVLTLAFVLNLRSRGGSDGACVMEVSKGAWRCRGGS
jgi:hypothetical protein